MCSRLVWRGHQEKRRGRSNEIVNDESELQPTRLCDGLTEANPLGEFLSWQYELNRVDVSCLRAKLRVLIIH